MPDLPERLFYLPSIAKEKQAKKNSKPYWCHPTCTVYEYLHESQQRRQEIDQECHEIEAMHRKTGLPHGLTPAQFEALPAEQQREVDRQIEATNSPRPPAKRTPGRRGRASKSARPDAETPSP